MAGTMAEVRSMRPADEVVVPDYTPSIYGALLVTTLVAVQWQADAVTGLIALTLVTSVGVFWLAHVWAAVVNRRLHGSIARGELVTIARDEAPMLASVVVPGLILAFGPVLGLSADLAIAVALAVSIAQLFVWGLAVGRAAHSSWHLALAVAAVDCALGILIVGLKVLVLH
jgi:hemolysin III